MSKKLLIVLLLLTTMTMGSRVKADDCDGDVASIVIKSLDKGKNITFENPISPPNPKTVFSGLVKAIVNGDTTRVYCVDLFRQVGLDDTTYTDTCANVMSRIQYLLNEYYPYKLSYAGKLPDDNDEAASIDAVIWHFTDNLNLNTITNTVIRNRALNIKADVETNGNSSNPIVTFEIKPGTGPDDFYIRTVDENGLPIAVNNINLSISFGVLSSVMTSTDLTGNSVEMQVSGANGTSVITACAFAMYPQGSKIHSSTLVRQTFVIAEPVFGMRCITAEWGALPVEMSLFSSTVNNNNVTLNWTTTSETNNSGFDIERKNLNSEVWTKVGNVTGHGTSSSPWTYQYTDMNISSGSYNYRLKQIDYNGNFEYFNLNSEVNIGIPTKYSLSQNYPNPFNPTTKINFSIPENGMVTLKLFNIAGKEVMTLLNETKTAGHYTIDLNGNNLSTGVYYYGLTIGDFSIVKKMTLIK